jgi:hypothetical protein
MRKRGNCHAHCTSKCACLYYVCLSFVFSCVAASYYACDSTGLSHAIVLSEACEGKFFSEPLLKHYRTGYTSGRLLSRRS